MAQRKLTMRKIKEILRLKWELKLSNRQAANSLRIAHRTVGEYIRRAKNAGLTWEEAQQLGEDELKERLFPAKKENLTQRPRPDWAYVAKELKGKNVTRMLVWEEFIREQPDGIGYSQFCQQFREWQKGKKKPVLRIPKKVGDEVQVDYTGHKIPIIDPNTGEVWQAEIFVGVLGASGLIYAEAQERQTKPNWNRGHVRMFEFFGGVPKLIRPDNLKSGVTTPSFYDPDLNPTYHELSVHYGTAVMPTRPRKPKDKGLGENAVLQVERRILAALRKERFFSLHELNVAIKALLKELNDRERSDGPFSRRELFENKEREALLPLPAHRFEYLEVKKTKVHVDYHIRFEKHLYSVPHAYIGQYVLVRATEHLVEIYAKEKRIACHTRNKKRGVSTRKEHMPANHRWLTDWSPERFQKWARKIGSSTEQIISMELLSRRHPEQAYRASLGILNLAKKESPEMLELACQYALEMDVYGYRAVKNILEKKKDMFEERCFREPVSHEHIRGNGYYS